MEETTQLTAREAKTLALRNKAIDHILNEPELSQEEIATKLGIGRTTLYNIINEENTQSLLRRQLHELETSILEDIKILQEDTKNPQNRRYASKLKLELYKQINDKVRKTRTEQLNLNVNLDLNKLQQTQQLFDEAMATLPHTTRQQFWQTVQQLKQQKGIQ